MDRLTSLTVFTRVVDSGGFSAAARRLNMSATMVSSHVQALEDHLGARLLNRTTRKVSLTEVGKVYYERCVQILAELAEADRVAGALQSMPRGTLRIYTNTHIVRFLAPVITEFLTLYPDVSIELGMGERMVDLVEEGIDLAIRTLQPSDASLIVRRLSPWQHFLCAAPAYLEKHGMPQVLEDLTRHNCLRYAFYPFGDEWRFIGPDGKPAAVRVSGNLLSASGETLQHVALAGQGLFLAPSFIAGEDLRAGRLVQVLEAYRPMEFAINAIYPHRHHLSAKVRAFIDLAAARFAAHRQTLAPDVAA
ncbi:LysR family transcriptional regulator [Vineibacter terrae]|uniref:LysR family transcriptional regulator n=1 Tax=Vineibacter terrae TaxID=2586908 RepID=UPI002E36249C|nr:LysR family transcriptional regulator [Vineibacter terrae]HEX2885610.1 LysR family transcriptional regulator [Vineibacter terrae]